MSAPPELRLAIPWGSEVHTRSERPGAWPMILYKYMKPDRVDVLEDNLIRYTQPGEFNDPFESSPHSASFAAAEEIDRISENVVQQDGDRMWAELPAESKAKVGRSEYDRLLEGLAPVATSMFTDLSKGLMPLFRAELLKSANQHLGILSLSVFLPYWILLKAALSNAWAMPLTWDNFTLKNFSFAFFEYGDTQRAIYNTFKLGILTATIGTLVATLIAYITNRNLFRGARYLSFFALAPLVIPGIVLAVGLFIAYTKPPLVLYGTIWILFVAYLTKEMPIGFSQAESTFKSIHPELEDASRIIGANRLLALKDVTAPLARSGLIAAWSFIFIGVIRELSASILLFAPASKVVSVVIFDLKEEGQVGVISVLGILLLLASFAVILVMHWFAGRDVVVTRE